MREPQLTRRLLDGLPSIAGTRLLGPPDTHDRRGVVAFSVAGLTAEAVFRALDQRGVALRGFHCGQLLVRAFGVDGAGRASLEPYSVKGNIDAAGPIAATLVADSHRCSSWP